MKNEFVDGRVNTASKGIYFRLQKDNYAVCRIVPYSMLLDIRSRNCLIISVIEEMQSQLSKQETRRRNKF